MEVSLIEEKKVIEVGREAWVKCGKGGVIIFGGGDSDERIEGGGK